MVFSRRCFLILLVLTLSSGPLMAASREYRAYSAAVAAFQDGRYTAAEAELTQFLQTYHKSTNAPAAMLLLAQSEFHLKNYSVAANRLSDPANLGKARSAGLGDQYDYWRGEAQFAAGDTAGAAETFISVGKNYPDSVLALRALVEAAGVFARNADWGRVNDLIEHTNGLFQRRAQTDPTNQLVATGRLLQAQSKCARQDFAGAIEVLGLVKTITLAPEDDWQRAWLVYRADFGAGNLEGALTAATNLVQIARQGHGDAWINNLAESIACQAEALETAGRLADAAAVWQANLASNVPAEQQRRAILKVADLALAQGNLGAAEAGLGGFLTSYPDSPAASVARMRLGELQLQEAFNQSAATNQLRQARSNLEAVVEVDRSGPLAGKTQLDLGWCDWLLAANAWESGDTNGARVNYGESENNFRAAGEILPRGSEDLAVACFKRGDAEFALGKYGEAINSYRSVLADFSTLTKVMSSLGARSLYQILRAQLELHDTNGMDVSMSQLLSKFGENGEATNGLLLAGQGFSDFGDPAKARALFERFGRERTDPRLMAKVSFALARTYAREGNWPATVTNCEAWLQNYPADEARAAVEYERDLAVGQTGDEQRAFGLFTNFLVHYPTNADMTPSARFWVADYYFRHGTNFVDAEREYERIYQDFQDDRLAGPARLMAARSAIALSSYSQAIDLHLTKLIDNTNAPGYLRDKARLAYCEAARGMALVATNTQSLIDATSVLAEMYGETPTNIVGALAWCETGDCDQLMGSLDAATNAYAQVLSAPSASSELRGRARVGLGQALEKKAEGLPSEARHSLLSSALQNYTAVIYTDEQQSDPYWMKEAAFRALPLMPLVEGDANLFIDRLEALLPQLKEALEKKRSVTAQK